MDPKVVWWILGLAGTAGIFMYRVSQQEKWLSELRKRTESLEQWRCGVTKTLESHEKRLDKAED